MRGNRGPLGIVPESRFTQSGALPLNQIALPGPAGLWEVDLEQVKAVLARAGTLAELVLAQIGNARSRSEFEQAARIVAWAGVPGIALCREKFQSDLADDMLLAYLRGSIDRKTLDRIRKDLQEKDQNPEGNETWPTATALVHDAIREWFRSTYPKRQSAPPRGEVWQVADEKIREILKAGLLEWREKNNVVIGGARGASVVDCQVREVAGGGLRGFAYHLEVRITDIYDFQNDRSDDPAYDGFRRDLLALVQAGDYGTFAVRLANALASGDPVSPTQAFASFMFAIESAGIVGPGLDWGVDLPMEGTVSYENP